MNRRVFLASFAVAMAPWVTAANAEDKDLLVVVHPRNEFQRLDRDALRGLFLTKKRSWGDGLAVIALNLRAGHPAREKFDMAVLGLTPDESQKYWIDRRIRGGAPPPRAVGSYQAVINLVTREQGAIGYIAASESTSRIKVVARVRGDEVLEP